MKNIILSLIICTKKPSKEVFLLCDNIASQIEALDNFCSELIIVHSFTEIKERKELNVFLKQKHPLLVTKELLQTIYSPKKGISFARNTGIKKSKGKYIYFIDDDIIPPTLFLESILGYISKEPSRVFFGEVIPICKEVNQNEQKMLNLIESTPWVLTCITKNNQKKMLPYTANCGFDRVLFKEYGLFSTSLGSSEGPIAMNFGEDPELFFRFKDANVDFSFVTELTVSHRITKERFSFRYMILRYFDHGKNMALIECYHSRNLSSAFNIIIKKIFTNVDLGWQAPKGKLFFRKILFNIFTTIGFIFMIFQIKKNKKYFIKNYGDNNVLTI